MTIHRPPASGSLAVTDRWPYRVRKLGEHAPSARPVSISAAVRARPSRRSAGANLLCSGTRVGHTYVDCGSNIGHLALAGGGLVPRRS